MAKYRCTICGYVYDESAGDPERGISKGTKWEDLPDGWRCPVCGAGKEAFAPEASDPAPSRAAGAVLGSSGSDGTRQTPDGAGKAPQALSYGLIGVLCSNFARGTEKQYRAEESKLWAELADFYHTLSKRETGSLGGTREKNEDDAAAFPAAKALATERGDRGALRALIWSEKVTAALRSLYARYEKESDRLSENTRIYVCEICGFVYIGNEPPEICPVCKVPKLKIHAVGGKK